MEEQSNVKFRVFMVACTLILGFLIFGLKKVGDDQCAIAGVSPETGKPITAISKVTILDDKKVVNNGLVVLGCFPILAVMLFLCRESHQGLLAKVVDFVGKVLSVSCRWTFLFLEALILILRAPPAAMVIRVGILAVAFWLHKSMPGIFGCTILALAYILVLFGVVRLFLKYYKSGGHTTCG